MTTYSTLKQNCHPDDNEVFIPKGFTGILVNDDYDAETDQVDLNSLPNPGDVVWVVVDDRVNYDHVLREIFAKQEGKEYHPVRIELAQYNGLNHWGYPKFALLLNRSDTVVNGYTAVREDTGRTVIAWKPIGSKPELEYDN